MLKNTRNLFLAASASLFLSLSAAAQQAVTFDHSIQVIPSIALSLPDPGSIRPVLSPELALDFFQARMQQQNLALGSYSDTTIIEADLPDTAQQGRYELKRQYSAPSKLQFTPVSFSGDGFVKSNVMIRLLQSEADHVNKGETALTALSRQNYKFSYKGPGQIDGRSVYVYQVKPRKKRAGLFKGRIYVDLHTAQLVRAEGNVISPSFFVKKIEFVQDYIEVAGFVLPARLHSISKARFIGRAIVNIFHKDYQAVAADISGPSVAAVHPKAVGAIEDIGASQ